MVDFARSEVCAGLARRVWTAPTGWLLLTYAALATDQHQNNAKI